MSGRGCGVETVPNYYADYNTSVAHDEETRGKNDNNNKKKKKIDHAASLCALNMQNNVLLD